MFQNAEIVLAYSYSGCTVSIVAHYFSIMNRSNCAGTRAKTQVQTRRGSAILIWRPRDKRAVLTFAVQRRKNTRVLRSADLPHGPKRLGWLLLSRFGFLGREAKCPHPAALKVAFVTLDRGEEAIRTYKRFRLR